MFSRLLTKRLKKPAGAPGFRLYAIGDIHGHADLLADLLEQRGSDEAPRIRAFTEPLADAKSCRAIDRRPR